MSQTELDQVLAFRKQSAGEIVNVDEPSRKLVIFEVGEGCYGLPGSHVREILSMVPIYFVPGLPPAMAGVIHLRGEIASVMRLNVLVGGSERPITRHSSILMAQAAQIESGLLVDRVVDVVDVVASAIHPQPKALPDGLRTKVAGEFTHGQRLVTLLDLEKIFQEYKDGRR